MAKVVVVQASVCKNCESLIGKEKKVRMEESIVLEKIKTEKDTFFEYKDPFHQTNYRQLFYHSHCLQC